MNLITTKRRLTQAVILALIMLCVPVWALNFRVGFTGDSLRYAVTVTAVPNSGSTGPSSQTIITINHVAYFYDASDPWRGTITPTLSGYSFSPTNITVRFSSDTIVYFNASLISFTSEKEISKDQNIINIYSRNNKIIIGGLLPSLPFEIAFFDLSGKLIYRINAISSSGTWTKPKTKSPCIIRVRQNNQTVQKLFTIN